MTYLNVTLTEEERQLILLALGRLAAERQGFDDALGRIASKLLGEAMYESFRGMAREERCEELPSITCPRCGMKSFHPQDISYRYCGNCHEFHGG